MHRSTPPDKATAGLHNTAAEYKNVLYSDPHCASAEPARFLNSVRSAGVSMPAGRVCSFNNYLSLLKNRSYSVAIKQAGGGDDKRDYAAASEQQDKKEERRKRAAGGKAGGGAQGRETKTK